MRLTECRQSGLEGDRVTQQHVVSALGLQGQTGVYKPCPPGPAVHIIAAVAALSPGPLPHMAARASHHMQTPAAQVPDLLRSAYTRA